MKKLILIFIAGFLFISCQDTEDKIYTGKELLYDLQKASDYDYSGKAKIREFISGDLELTITLEGNKVTGEAYFFPAHLHYGTYDSPDAKMALMLSPIDHRIQESKTLLGLLSDGRKLSFEEFKNFDGHIKVHLADSGPDYSVILVAGNVGIHGNKMETFRKENITGCSPYFE